MIETGQSVATETPALESPLAPHARVGTIYRQTVRDNLPGILAWGGGYGVLIALVTALYPVLRENNTLLGIVRSLGLIGVGGGAINVQSLTSFSGYIGLQALSLAPLVLSVYVIPQALNAVAREEERGTLDILLSTPMPRWRFITEKTLATVTSLTGILLIMWVTLVVATHVVQGVEFPVTNSTAGIWHVFPIMMVIMMAALLLSVTVRNTRSAGGWTAVFVIASYFIRSLTDLVRDVDFLEFLKQFSIFSYYKSVAVLSNGFQFQSDALLLAVSVILFALALLQFQRRDLGV